MIVPVFGLKTNSAFGSANSAFGLRIYSPCSPSTKLIRSPGLRPSFFRTSEGMVICPLEVIAAVAIGTPQNRLYSRLVSSRMVKATPHSAKMPIGNLFFVGVEAMPGFAAQPAGVHHAHQQRTGAVLGIAETFLKRAQNVYADIEAD